MPKNRKTTPTRIPGRLQDRANAHIRLTGSAFKRVAVPQSSSAPKRKLLGL